MNSRRIERHIQFALLSAYANSGLALVKLALGIWGASPTLCLYALCSVGMAAAKWIAARSYRHIGDGGGDGESLFSNGEAGSQREEDLRVHTAVGAIIVATSVPFLLHSLYVYTRGGSADYPANVAIAIAAVTFTEIGMAIYGAIVAKRAGVRLVTLLKLTNLAFALFLLVLTQTAILSFADPRYLSTYNGLSGLLFGAGALSIGGYIVVRAGADRKRVGET
ncbi:hypothetical protein [Saccharibacillus sacchari]|uniref:Uncharacterized protein n=1 Tax=Saccharibacillus sacchari TaxID=456493 RepID=A0ACC6PAS6_9BACL